MKEFTGRTPLPYRLKRNDTVAEKVEKLERQIWYFDYHGTAEKETVALYKQYVGRRSNRDMVERIEQMPPDKQIQLLTAMKKLRNRNYEYARRQS